MLKLRSLIAVAIAAAVSATPAAAQDHFVYGGSGQSAQLVLNGSIFLTSVHQGWYRSDGYNSPGNSNYIVGHCQNCGGYDYRDFFEFNVPGIQVFSASLRLATYDITGGNQTVSFFDVTTPTSTLNNGTGGHAAFNDFGSGTFYGSQYYVDGVDDYGTKDIALNGAAVSAINNGGTFVIGGANDATTQTTSTPEPASFVLFGSGLAGLFGASRFRRRKAA